VVSYQSMFNWRGQYSAIFTTWHSTLISNH
jgi:hypothetical protein